MATDWLSLAGGNIGVGDMSPSPTTSTNSYVSSQGFTSGSSGMGSAGGGGGGGGATSVTIPKNNVVDMSVTNPQLYKDIQDIAIKQEAAKNPGSKNSDIYLPGGNYDAGDMLRSAGITGNKSALFEQYGVDNTPDLINAIRKAQEEKQRAYESQVRGEISGAYKPFYAALDKQIGYLPGQRAELEALVAQLSQQQMADVDLSTAGGMRSLDAAAGNQQKLATGSLRSLEDDIRNSMQAAGQYLGVRGAGDSSASLEASEALQRQAQKSRGGILETRNQALADIDLKRQEVNDLATQEKSKINQYKTEKMYGIAQEFQNKMREYEMLKANASKEEGVSIANMVLGSQQQFMQQMAELDKEVVGYQQGVDMWQMQRAAELEDYATKLSISKSFSGPGSDDYSSQLSKFASLANTFGSEAAASIYEQMYGSVLPANIKSGYDAQSAGANWDPRTIMENPTWGAQTQTETNPLLMSSGL